MCKCIHIYKCMQIYSLALGTNRRMYYEDQEKSDKA